MPLLPSIPPSFSPSPSPPVPLPRPLSPLCPLLPFLLYPRQEFRNSKEYLEHRQFAIDKWLEGAIASISQQHPQAAHPHEAAGAAVAGQPPAAPAPLAVGALAAEGAAGGGLREAARENEDEGEEVDG